MKLCHFAYSKIKFSVCTFSQIVGITVPTSLIGETVVPITLSGTVVPATFELMLKL